MDLMNEILTLAGCDSLYEFAQKQGVSEDKFVFYTLDGEYTSHKPHVHVCVSFDNKKFSNTSKRPLKNSLNSLCSITIPASCELTLDNFQFEETYKNTEIFTNKNIEDWIKFLNSPAKPYKNFLEKCLIDYMVSNCQTPYENICKHIKKSQEQNLTQIH